jgi:hypothetical protein
MPASLTRINRLEHRDALIRVIVKLGAVHSLHRGDVVRLSDIRLAQLARLVLTSVRTSARIKDLIRSSPRMSGRGR